MSRDRFTASGYHKLSLQEKQAEAMGRAREPAMTCPTCQTQIMPSDWTRHAAERCTGPREPGKGSKWIDWREATRVHGARQWDLSRWVRDGLVRVDGPRREQRYLLDDVIRRIADKRDRAIRNATLSRRRIRGNR